MNSIMIIMIASYPKPRWFPPQIEPLCVCRGLNFSCLSQVSKCTSRRNWKLVMKQPRFSPLLLVPLVLGALGTPAKELEKRLKTISIETKIILNYKKLSWYIPAESSEKLLRWEESCWHHTSKKYNISVGRNQRPTIQ